jgi:hypothetical protein
MRFQVTFQDRPTLMEYRVFKDDADCAYIYFLTDSQALADAIVSRMATFQEEQG